MSSISHPTPRVHDEPTRGSWFASADLWASLAIVSMWVAVVVVALTGPDIVSTTPGGSTTTVPAAVAVGLFACIASGVVARYGFGRSQRTD